ncbi:MAG: hypothetical protein C4537_06850 [Acholeplasma sp.]|jgi:hypothetical protein|nr:MAG: hypothetical protein C4537_06850 [Acholeplasma sp.]
MNDVQRINRRFLILFISFLILVASAVIGMIMASLRIVDGNIQYVVYFGILLLMIILVSLYKTAFDRTSHLAYLIKIRHFQGTPLPINHSQNDVLLEQKLRQMEFSRLMMDKKHQTFYKVTRDQIRNRLLKRFVLEVVVLISDDVNEFYLDEVDHDIERIQQQELSEQRKIDRMMITQIRHFKDITDEMKEQIKEIVFVNHNGGIISTINIGLHHPSSQAVLLYGDPYFPSLYYKYHVDQIKTFI